MSRISDKLVSIFQDENVHLNKPIVVAMDGGSAIAADKLVSYSDDVLVLGFKENVNYIDVDKISHFTV